MHSRFPHRMPWPTIVFFAAAVIVLTVRSLHPSGVAVHDTPRGEQTLQADRPQMPASPRDT